MYQLLIADDEKLMRTYLVENTNSICPYFQINGIASDGREAMALLDCKHFDAVVTDIRMPEIDGIALSKYIYEKYPSIKVIIISGYSDFDYAKNAITYQVSDYLLKPLNDDEYQKSLLKIKNTLDNEKKKIARESFSFSTYSTPYLMTKLLEMIWAGDEEMFLQICDQLSRRNASITDYKYYSTLSISFDELQAIILMERTDITSMLLQVVSICHKFCDARLLPLCNDEGGNIRILFYGNDKEKLKVTIKEIYQLILSEFKQNRLHVSTAIISSFVNDILDVPEASESAESIAVRYISNSQSELLFVDNLVNADAQAIFVQDICHNIYLDYISENEDRLYINIHKYCLVPEEQLTIRTELQYSSFLLRYLFRRSNIRLHVRRKCYLRIKDAIDKQIQTGHITIDDMALMLKNVIISISKHASTVPETKANDPVEKAKSYILNHFQEPISLTQIADEIGINSCYLSDLIHKSMGITYSKFVSKIRMDQAAKLLCEHPEMKVYSIAEAVGFASTKHFITAFKKTYGTTPAQYAENKGKI
ncbi:MAG: response regulator [Lachnospiraceae bacterium]|nr:response regulator [Lachnospiraceae bacterium]